MAVRSLRGLYWHNKVAIIVMHIGAMMKSTLKIGMIGIYKILKRLVEVQLYYRKLHSFGAAINSYDWCKKLVWMAR